MALARGTPNISRVHARNYTQATAQQRLQESVAPYQRQGLNALGVDNHRVFLYIKQLSTTACSCREVQTETALGSANAHVNFSGIESETEINIDWSRPLFGEKNEARFEEDSPSADEYGFDDSTVPHANHILESSADCGICYRSGFVPGFEQYGKKRVVFTTHDFVDQFSYNIDRSLAPHTFNKLHHSGWVAFDLKVPKYFKSASYSIRNGFAQLPNRLFCSGHQLSLSELKVNAGKTISVVVAAETFTHLVFVFDLGTEDVFANVAQQSRQTDWTSFEAMSNLNVILPMTIKELSVGSLLWLPDKRMGLWITDITYLRTSDGRNLDWSCNTRVAQPQESWKNIAKSVKLL